MTPRLIAEELRARLREGDLREALLVLRAAVLAYPTHVHFAEQFALVLHRMGDLSAAEVARARAVELGGETRALLLLRADLRGRAQDAAGAAEAAAALQARFPTDEEALRAAIAALESVNDAGAAAVWDALATRAVLTPMDLRRAARAAMQAGDLAGARQRLDAALARDPAALPDRIGAWLADSATDRFDGPGALARLAAEDPAAAARFLPILLAHSEDAALLATARIGAASPVGDDVVVAIKEAAARRAGAGDDLGALTLLGARQLLRPDDAVVVADTERAFAAVLERAQSAAKAGSPDVAATLQVLTASPAAAGELGELASLAEAINHPVTAFDLWLRAGGEEDLARAMAAAEKISPATEALALLLSRADVPRHAPIVRAVGDRLAKRVAKEALPGEPARCAARDEAARLLHAWGASSGALEQAARKHLAALLAEMKAADLAGEAAKAIALATAAARVDPARSFPMKVLARLHRESGDVAASKAATLRLIELEPEDAGHAIRLAKRCRAQGSMAEAVSALLRAAEQRPGEAEVALLLDECLTAPLD